MGLSFSPDRYRYPASYSEEQLYNEVSVVVFSKFWGVEDLLMSFLSYFNYSVVVIR